MEAYLGLGTNLGDRRGNLHAAIAHLRAIPGIMVGALSTVYETTPVGYTDQPDFYNMAARIETSLPPRDLLDAVLSIERKMGRERTVKWGPRVIDIDILLYGDLRLQEPDLTIPHPRLAERAFVLIPLAEIAPDVEIPGEERRIHTILKTVTQIGNVSRAVYVH